MSLWHEMPWIQTPVFVLFLHSFFQITCTLQSTAFFLFVLSGSLQNLTTLKVKSVVWQADFLFQINCILTLSSVALVLWNARSFSTGKWVTLVQNVSNAIYRVIHQGSVKFESRCNGNHKLSFSRGTLTLLIYICDNSTSKNTSMLQEIC